MKKIFFFLFVLTLTLSITPIKAEDTTDDIYQPSSDFGFDLKQEKEDETFFYFGRLFMLGGNAGLRVFTGSLGRIYDPGPEMGLFATYFFTLGFSAELLLDYSWHNFVVDQTSGNISMLNVNLNAKYYITSTTFTRTLVYANPYIFAGVGEYFRFTSSPRFPRATKENAFGIDFGGGFEFPVSERKFYLGLRFIYHWIFFKDEDQRSPGGAPLDGDAISVLATFNYNF